MRRFFCRNPKLCGQRLIRYAILKRVGENLQNNTWNPSEIHDALY